MFEKETRSTILANVVPLLVMNFFNMPRQITRGRGTERTHFANEVLFLLHFAIEIVYTA